MGIGYPDTTTPARVKTVGKDPLTEGFRLHNVTNSSDATSYEMSTNPVVAPRPKNDTVVIGADGVTPPIPVMPVHKSRNLSREAQAKVAKGRVEKSAVKPKKK